MDGKQVVVDPAVPLASKRERRLRLLVAGAAMLTGVVLATIWSYRLADGLIGDNVANTLLGRDARETAIAGTTAGLMFALVSGLAGTFTACNIAVFGLLPKIAAGASTRHLAGSVFGPLGWMAVGMVSVSGAYGAVGVALGQRLPQLSSATVGGMPARLVQAAVVFGLIGVAFAYLGLATLGLLPDPFAGRPRALLVVLGGLVGGFLAGRPFPLFRQLFEHAVAAENLGYGAAAFVLQSLGNMAVVAVLVALIVVVTRGAVVQWLAARPHYAATSAGAALLGLGVFMITYWDIRVPSLFGIGWFPTLPWT